MKKNNPSQSKKGKELQSKPNKTDKKEQIPFTLAQIFICEGKKCKGKSGEDTAKKLKKIVKKMDLDKGENRIKVTKTLCDGSCSLGQFSYSYKNSKSEKFSKENAFTAWKNVHKWTESQWTELLLFLAKNKPYSTIDSSKVEQKVP